MKCAFDSIIVKFSLQSHSAFFLSGFPLLAILSSIHLKEMDYRNGLLIKLNTIL